MTPVVAKNCILRAFFVQMMILIIIYFRVSFNVLDLYFGQCILVYIRQNPSLTASVVFEA